MTATDTQVRIIMRERRQGKTQEQAAAKANLSSRKTVKKYEFLGKLPSELKKAREYRTRNDPFEEDWAEVERMLEKAPELEAKTLFEWLCERHTEKYQEGQLRTFQRRVSTWRALNGNKILSLEQVRHPGEMMQTDGTWMTELGITINGQEFPHLLIHSVLPYSNWEWGRIAQSESLLAIRLGVQSTLVKLGYVPKIHQTDNSTAATHKLGPKAREKSLEERGFNDEYLQLMAHFGMEAQTIHIGASNENGDIEASNGSFKQAVEQHLLLRGSRDLESLEAYETFLWQIMDQRNALRSEKLAEELAVMKPLTVDPWPEMRELRPRVNRAGLIRVQNNGYSVPSGLRGKRVTARVYEWKIEVWYANQCVETLPKLTGIKKYHINYRHVIDTLLRKPGGFRNYRYREDLFPTFVFRQAWDALQERLSPRKADIAFLRILKLAADGMENEVAAVLEDLLNTQASWNDQMVAKRVQPLQPSIPNLQEHIVNLSEYDRLLSQEVSYEAA
ncbi:MAG: DDE-type integrase/transposase/recombinase [Deltaproteobacteria bacterium]|nr:DDE-type integrase/transposase/recombinase [Deltaproteobacteria bacterium]